MNNNYTHLYTTYEKGIIQKLQYQWKELVKKRCLAYPEIASSIRMPVINISEMHKTLGMWIKEHNEIRLNRELVNRGRWDSILEVFLHEMAHQMASTSSLSSRETPHGEIFHKCCQIIGANPKASGNYQSLEERIWNDEDQNSESDRIMIKVKKLMSLASSGNHHEAEAAAAKANELIARYNVDMIRHDRKRGFESIIITEPTLKMSQYHSLAASILTNFYFVRGIWLFIYMPEKQQWGKAFEISGTPTNLKIADYVFNYIIGYAEQSWKQYKKANPSCRSRSGYMTGVLYGFMKKLEEQQKESEISQRREQSNDYIPATIEDQRLALYYEKRHPDTVSKKTSYYSRSASAYNSGMEQGKNLTISKGITSSGKTGGGYLTQ
ncbi:conserved hypothetical protein [Desulfamplus magnetovallimortis]|uniref:DUF2786 domain-containing protein n=1 Tax=Desulfamplus magnetovallimortis TaxID=1246637 RepID=A0A1W1H709_9BACT|nr:SprT-like domain-containing protein [Desulfamplus magnetovallimortis]SLM28216.1 conserved hypothetical protein [Desulfamplus magnetovallimortis]